MKLIWEYWEPSEGYSDTYHICFEYESKEKFLFDIFEKVKGFKETDKIEIFGQFLYADQVLDIESNLYTYDEWFLNLAEGYKEYLPQNFIKISK